MHNTIAAVLFVVPTIMQAQTLPRVPLKPSNATLEAEFVGITSIREVADGRVIVTDGRDQQLYVADFKAKSATVLGRKGKGPGEWLNVGFIHALTGDSSFIGDFGNRRWLLFDGARVVGQVSPDHPAVLATSALLSDVDRDGHILKVQNPPPRAGTTEFTRADSNTLTFVDRNTGRIDTITRLRMQPHRVDIQMDSLGRVRSSMPSLTEPNSQAERAKLFTDGWLAVVRLEPLRVDWRSPMGQWTRGKPFPLRPEPVDGEEPSGKGARERDSKSNEAPSPHRTGLGVHRSSNSSNGGQKAES